MPTTTTIAAPDTGGESDTFDHYEGADGCRYRRFRAGPDDYAPTVRLYPWESRNRDYNAKCPGCYLGFAHSTGFHDESTRVH